MQDIVNSVARLMAIIDGANIATNETKVAPLLRCHQLPHLVKIVLMASGKVVQSNDLLIQLKQ